QFKLTGLRWPQFRPLGEHQPAVSEMRTTFAAMWPVIYLFTVLGALVFIVIVAVTVYRLSREQERRQNLRRLLPWLIKGFALPFALWVVMNLGISWRLQPFMPQVQAAQNSGTN